ncbi:MAG: metallophosphoesterase family protein, partial [Anaerolineae bacterium]|nr:metallophosphoesterase family protein [Anaerolineae bacterium]
MNLKHNLTFPIFFTLLIVLLLGVGGAVAPVQAAPLLDTTTFAGGELLGKPTDTSITINIVPASTIEYYYEYGTDEGGPYPHATSPVTAQGGQPHEVVITDLSPATRYYYRMIYDADGDVDDGDYEVRPEHTFHTQRAEGESFVFTVTSDSHGSFGANTATNILNNGPDFHIDLGDTFMVDTLSETQSAYNGRYEQWRGTSYFGGIGQSVPICLTMGNHEEEEGWNLNDTPSRALLNIEARKLYFPMPHDGSFYSASTETLADLSGDQLRENYYAWEWGDALFVVMDPFQHTMNLPYNPIAGEEGDETVNGDQWSWSFGIDQYTWLKSTLENSDAKYKFVFSHQMVGGVTTPGVSGGPGYVRGGAEAAGYFEWGGYNGSGTREWATKRPSAEGWDVPIQQLFTENGVSAYFHGHDHQFVYEKRDGVVYQLVPQPSTSGSGFG